MTVINPRKEYRRNRESNQQSPVYKSRPPPNELWGGSASNDTKPKKDLCKKASYQERMPTAQ